MIIWYHRNSFIPNGPAWTLGRLSAPPTCKLAPNESVFLVPGTEPL